MTADDVARAAAAAWPRDDRAKGDGWVVITGGEPALQLAVELLDALRAEGFEGFIAGRFRVAQAVSERFGSVRA
jgi:organic radical activating enzyme